MLGETGPLEVTDQARAEYWHAPMTDATQDFDGSSPLSVAGIQYASQHGAYSPSIRVYNVSAGMVMWTWEA